VVRTVDRKLNFWIAGYYDDYNGARALPDDANTAIPSSYDGYETTHQGNPMNGNAPLNPRYRYSWVERKTTYTALSGNTTWRGPFGAILNAGLEALPEVYHKRFLHNGGIHEYITHDKHALGSENDGTIGYAGRAQLEYPCTLVGNRWIYGGYTSHYSTAQSYTLFCNGYNTDGEYLVWSGSTDATHGRSLIYGADFQIPVNWASGSNGMSVSVASPTIHQYGYLTSIWSNVWHDHSGWPSYGPDYRGGAWTPNAQTAQIKSPAGKPFFALAGFHDKSLVYGGGAALTRLFQMLYDGDLNPSSIEDWFGIRMSSFMWQADDHTTYQEADGQSTGVNYSLKVGYDSTASLVAGDNGYKTSGGSNATAAIEWVFNPVSGVGGGGAWTVIPYEWNTDDTTNLREYTNEDLWKDIEFKIDWANHQYRVYVDGAEVTGNTLMPGGNQTAPYSFANGSITPSIAYGWQIEYAPIIQSNNRSLHVHTLIDRTYCGKDLSNNIPIMSPVTDPDIQFSNWSLSRQINGIGKAVLTYYDDDNNTLFNTLLHGVSEEPNDWELLAFRDNVDRPFWRGFLDKISTNQGRDNEKKVTLRASDALAVMNRSIPMWEIGQSSRGEFSITDFRETEMSRLYERLNTGVKSLEIHEPEISGTYDDDYSPLKSQRTLLHSGHPIQMYAGEDDDGPNQVYRDFEAYPIAGITDMGHSSNTQANQFRIYFPRTSGTQNEFVAGLSVSDTIKLYNLPQRTYYGDTQAAYNAAPHDFTVEAIGQQGGGLGSDQGNHSSGRPWGATDINNVDQDADPTGEFFFDWVVVSKGASAGTDYFTPDTKIIYHKLWWGGNSWPTQTPERSTHANFNANGDQNLAICVDGLVNTEYGMALTRDSIIGITDYWGGEVQLNHHWYAGGNMATHTPQHTTEWTDTSDPNYEHIHSATTYKTKWAGFSYEGMHRVVYIREMTQTLIDEWNVAVAAYVASGASGTMAGPVQNTPYTEIGLMTSFKGLVQDPTSRGSYGVNPVTYNPAGGSNDISATTAMYMSVCKPNAYKSTMRPPKFNYRDIHARWIEDLKKSMRFKQLFAPIEKTPIVTFTIPHALATSDTQITWSGTAGDFKSRYAYVAAIQSGSGYYGQDGIDIPNDGAILEFWSADGTTLLDTAICDGTVSTTGSLSYDNTIYPTRCNASNPSIPGQGGFLYPYEPNPTGSATHDYQKHWSSRATMTLTTGLDGVWVYIGKQSTDPATRNGLNAEGLAYDGVWQLELADATKLPGTSSRPGGSAYSRITTPTITSPRGRGSVSQISNTTVYWLKDADGNYLSTRDRGFWDTQHLTTPGYVGSAATMGSLYFGAGGTFTIGNLYGHSVDIPTGAIVKVRRYRDEYKHLWVLWADMRNDGTADADGGSRKTDFGLIYPVSQNYDLSLTYVDQNDTEGNLEKYLSFSVGEDCDIWAFDATSEWVRDAKGESDKAWSAISGASNDEDNSMYHDWEDKAGAFIVIDFSKFFNLNTAANGGSTGRNSGGKKDLGDFETDSEGSPILVDNYWLQAIANFNNSEGEIRRNPKAKFFLADVQLATESIRIGDSSINIESTTLFPQVGVGLLTATDGNTIERAYVSWNGKGDTELLNVYTVDYYQMATNITSGSSGVTGMLDAIEQIMISNTLMNAVRSSSTTINSNWELAKEDEVVPGLTWEQIQISSNLANRIPLRLMLNLEGFVESRNTGTYYLHDKFRMLWMLGLTKHWSQQTTLPCIHDINNIPIANNHVTDLTVGAPYYTEDDFGSVTDVRGKTLLGAIQEIITGASYGKVNGHFLNWGFFMDRDGRFAFRPPYNSGWILNRDNINYSDLTTDMSGQITSVRVFYRGGKSFVDYPEPSSMNTKSKWRLVEMPDVVSSSEARAIAQAEYSKAKKSSKKLVVEFIKDLNTDDKMLGGARYGYIADPATWFGGPDGKPVNQEQWFWGSSMGGCPHMGIQNGLDGNLTGYAGDGKDIVGIPFGGEDHWNGMGYDPADVQVLNGWIGEHGRGASECAHFDTYRTPVDNAAAATIWLWHEWYYWYGAKSLSKAVQVVHVPQHFPYVSGTNTAGFRNHELRIVVALTPGQTHGDIDSATFDVILFDPLIDDDTSATPTFSSSERGSGGIGSSTSSSKVTVRANGLWECPVPASYVAGSDCPSSATIVFSVNVDYLRSLLRHRCYHPTTAIKCQNAHNLDAVYQTDGGSSGTFNQNSLFPLGIRHYPEYGLPNASSTFYGHGGQAIYHAPRLHIVDDLNFNPGQIVHITDDRLSMTNEQYLVSRVDWVINGRNVETVKLTLTEDTSKLSGDMYGFLYPQLNTSQSGGSNNDDRYWGGGGTGGTSGTSNKGDSDRGNTDENKDIKDDGSEDTDYSRRAGSSSQNLNVRGGTPGGSGTDYQGKQTGINEIESGMINRIKDRMNMGSDINAGGNFGQALGGSSQKATNQGVSSVPNVRFQVTSGGAVNSDEGLVLPGVWPSSTGETLNPTLHEAEAVLSIPNNVSQAGFTINIQASLGTIAELSSQAVLMAKVEIIETGDSFSRNVILARSTEGDLGNPHQVIAHNTPTSATTNEGSAGDNSNRQHFGDIERTKYVLAENARLKGSDGAGNTMKITLSRVFDGTDDTAGNHAIVIHDLDIMFKASPLAGVSEAANIEPYPIYDNKKNLGKNQDRRRGSF